MEPLSVFEARQYAWSASRQESTSQWSPSLPICCCDICQPENSTAIALPDELHWDKEAYHVAAGIVDRGFTGLLVAGSPLFVLRFQPSLSLSVLSDAFWFFSES